MFDISYVAFKSRHPVRVIVYHPQAIHDTGS